MSFAAGAADAARRLAAVADLNAVLAWSPEELMAEADRVSRNAPNGPLAGMPVAVKDNIVTTELPTTCASRVLRGYRSPFAATAVERLRAAGGLVAGKTNLDEFAMGASTEHSAFGPVANPLDRSRVPGGSSGGSAAVVAAGAVRAALGSETGGSVRQPAAFCGVVGVKPSYGRVSRYGLVAFGSSLDCIGVFGATVREAWMVLEAIAGPDPRDATTRVLPALGPPRQPSTLAGLTVGLPAEYLGADLDPAVRASVDRAAGHCRELGARVVSVSLPHTRFAVPTYYVLAPAEAAANLARYDGVRYGYRASGAARLSELYRRTRGEGFGREVRRRILIGTHVLSAGYYDAYYARAQAARRWIQHDFRTVFAGGVDLLLTPTTPTPAFQAGSKLTDPVAMYLADVFVSAVSLAGLPALSLPAGRTEGLPLGVQLIGHDGGEATILSAASTLEAVLPASAEVR